MELLEGLAKLFSEHAPETLMALFGAGSSILLFYLVWTLLRHLFGLQTKTTDQEVEQDQATANLLEALVAALVTEAGHLRTTLDGILGEALKRDEQTSYALADLISKTEETPHEVLGLLRPEFEYLHSEMHQVERRIISKVIEMAERPEEDPGARRSDSVN